MVPVLSLRDKVVRGAWVVLVVLVVVTVVMTAVGMVVNRRQHSASVPRPRFSPAPTVHLLTDSDLVVSADGFVVFGDEVRVRLPVAADGFELATQQNSAKGVFSAVYLSVVNQDTSKGTVPSAAMAGSVAPVFAVEQRVATAETLLVTMMRKFYSDKTIPDRASVDAHEVDAWEPKHPAAVAKTAVQRTVKGRQVTDRWTFALVQVQYDSWLGVYTIANGENSAAAQQKAEAVTQTIEYRRS